MDEQRVGRASQMGRLQQFCLQNQIGRGFPVWEAGLEGHRMSGDIGAPRRWSAFRQEALREAGPVGSHADR